MAIASVGAGALAAQSAQINGIGITLSIGDAVLVAQTSSVSGVGTVGTSEITGTGMLQAQASTVAGTGAITSKLGLIGEKREKKHGIPLWQILYEIDRQKDEQDRLSREKARAEAGAIRKAVVEARAQKKVLLARQTTELAAMELARIAEIAIEAERIDDDKRRRLLLLATESDYFH